MNKKQHWKIGETFEKLSEAVTRWAGSTSAFATAVAVIIVWAAVGPIFRYSDTWQLVINTGTTIVTFLMVFLIQRSQNKDAIAIHLKLNEIVAAMEGSSNRLIDVEGLASPNLTPSKKLATVTRQRNEGRHNTYQDVFHPRHRGKNNNSSGTSVRSAR
jgi:low affinity Fe/Cu permease